MNSSTTRWFDEESSVLAALRDARDGDAAAGAGAPEFPGFRVIGEIGRGGQGVVLAARQLATRRLVAIKVLAEGAMAGAERLRRFEREMEIVATLDHPGIVRVFGGGADPQPHIVMEQVDGVPFGRFAEAVDRDPRRLAATIAEVCGALDVAHRKGVIHRDVKPSNVLVGSDERPRIVDFGLARSAAVGRQATATGSGQFLGSIPWASPEHASGDPSRIETRSDIYSVGVLLFEALTGTFPYPVDGSLASTLHGIERADPARPSAIRRDIPRELDAIVLMALAKRPDDRYRSAGDMARDLRAFLSGEPLLARREGATAAMTRLVRRYRAVAIVSAIAAMALLALAVIALRQSAEAQSQRERAERRFGQVRQIVGRLLFDVHASIAGLEGARASRELIVTSALSYLRDLAPDAGDDAAFLAELATAWERVGDIQGNPLVPNLGQTEPAMASYREAIALRERIVSLAGSADADLVALARAQASLGVVELYGGRADAALLTLRSAVATVDRTSGEASSASDVVETRVRLLDGLSDVLALLGRGEEALEALRQAERLLDAASATVGGSEGLETKRGVVEGKLATTLWELGRPKDALGHSEKAVGLLRATAERGGGAAERRALSIELNTLALIRAELGDLARAEDALGESLAIRRRATEIDPSDAQASADLAHVLLRIGGVRARRGDADGMRAATDEAIALRTMLRERSPKDGSLRRGEAIAHAMRAEMHETLAALDGASAAQREAARRSAIEGYERAASLLDAMAAEGLLLPSDAGLPARMRSAAEAVRSKRGP